MAHGETSQGCRDVFDAVEGSVVRLSVAGGSPFIGSGFVVFHEQRARLIMTCMHVVDDLPPGAALRAHFSESRGPEDVPVRVVFVDARRDLALLRADDVPPGIGYSVGFFEYPITRYEVVLVAFFNMPDAPVMVRPGTFPGHIVTQPIVEQPEPNLVEFFRASYTSKPGTSGGPVVEPSSNLVVGVHAKGHAGAKLFISARSVRTALRQWLGLGVNEYASESIQDLIGLIAQQRRRSSKAEALGAAAAAAAALATLVGEQQRQQNAWSFFVVSSSKDDVVFRLNSCSTMHGAWVSNSNMSSPQ
uniref:Serine protease n=1 Tax=Oryza brachyantha TaxID=4533 RepID=J3MFU5_ORYBR